MATATRARIAVHTKENTLHAGERAATRATAEVVAAHVDARQFIAATAYLTHMLDLAEALNH